jgi:hypothetical protein
MDSKKRFTHLTWLIRLLLLLLLLGADNLLA